MRGLRRFFAFGKHSVGHASTLLAVTALLSNVLGLARNLVFYRLIPPGQLDVYFASFRISDLLFNLLLFGAITSALIPVLSELSSEKNDEAFRLTDGLLTWVVGALIILGFLLNIFMPELTRLLVPHFDPSRLALTVKLNRLMLLQPIFFGASFIIGALLNGMRRFSSYALAPLTYNISLIIGGFLASRYGITAITYAVIFGSICHFSLQYREARLIGYQARFAPKLTPKLKEVFRLMLPRNLAQGFAQLVPTVYINLASGLPLGSIAVYSGLNDIQTTPTVVIANSLATAAFPALAASVAQNEPEKLNALLTKVLRTSLFVLVPTVAMALILRAQLVRLYVGIGHANWGLTDVAISTFAWFMVGVIPSSLVVLLARVFYAHHDSRTPMLISVTGAALAMLVAFFGIRIVHGNIEWLAIAEVCSATFQCGLYIILLYSRRYIQLPLLTIGQHLLQYLAGSTLLLWLAWSTLQGVDALYARTGWLSTSKIIGLTVQTGLAALLGGLAYFGYSMLTTKEELRWLRRRSFTNLK